MSKVRKFLSFCRRCAASLSSGQGSPHKLRLRDTAFGSGTGLSPWPMQCAIWLQWSSLSTNWMEGGWGSPEQGPIHYPTRQRKLPPAWRQNQQHMLGNTRMASGQSSRPGSSTERWPENRGRGFFIAPKISKNEEMCKSVQWFPVVSSDFQCFSKFKDLQKLVGFQFLQGLQGPSPRIRLHLGGLSQTGWITAISRPPHLVGGWPTPLKNISQWEGWHPIYYGK